MAAKNQPNLVALITATQRVMTRLQEVRNDLDLFVQQHYDVPYDDVATQPNDNTGWLQLDPPAQSITPDGPPSTVQEISGTNVTPNDYLLGVVMAEQLLGFFNNQPVTQGDYASTLSNWTSPQTIT